jgi:hypothetical protein
MNHVWPVITIASDKIVALYVWRERHFPACWREDSVYFLKYENGRCPMGGRPRNIGCGKLCICRSFQKQDYQQHEFAADDQCS